MYILIMVNFHRWLAVGWRDTLWYFSELVTSENLPRAILIKTYF